MGSEKSQLPDKRQLTSSLKATFTVFSKGQQIYLCGLILKRSNYDNSHICGVKGYSIKPINNYSKLNCQDESQVTVFFELFDQYLININKRFNEEQIIYFLYCIADGLNYWKSIGLRHGDISRKTICKVGPRWKLIDTYFLRSGISAYQKILEGEEGFISPQQMQYLRQGYTRQSPSVRESDDIFALGMTTLQLMTNQSSLSCYKQSYIRFQTNAIQNKLASCIGLYSNQLIRIVEKMLSFDLEYRLKLNDILKWYRVTPYLRGKISMRQSNNLIITNQLNI